MAGRSSTHVGLEEDVPEDVFASIPDLSAREPLQPRVDVAARDDEVSIKSLFEGMRHDVQRVFDQEVVRLRTNVDTIVRELEHQVAADRREISRLREENDSLQRAKQRYARTLEALRRLATEVAEDAE